MNRIFEIKKTNYNLTKITTFQCGTDCLTYLCRKNWNIVTEDIKKIRNTLFLKQKLNKAVGPAT